MRHGPVGFLTTEDTETLRREKEEMSKIEDGEYVGQEVDDEEYGRATIEFENGENVTVRAHENGKMFVLPKSALIVNR